MMKRSFSLNIKLLCWFKALQMALFPLAIITIFWKEHVGMTVTDIMIVQAALAATIVITEFPSGYIADRLGYRATLLISAIIGAAAWSLYLISEQYWVVLVAEILYGLSLALVSGTDQSLLFESLTEIEAQDDYPKWSGRFQAFGQVGEAVAALCAATAYILNARLPFILEFVVCLINIVIVYLLVEPTRIKPSFGKTIQQMREIVGHIFVITPRLRELMILTLVLGLSTFIPVWLIQLYAKQAGAGLQVLSVNWALANLMVAVGAFISYRFRNLLGFTMSIVICILLLLTGYLGLGLNHMIYGFVFYYLLTLMRGINGPILMNEKQLLVTSENRAGMLSVQSLLFRATFFLVGPAVGWYIDITDMHTAFCTLAVIFTVISSISLFRVTRIENNK